MQSGARTISILILSRLHSLSHSQNTPSTPVTTPATTSPSPPATNPPPSPSTLSSPPPSTVTRRSWPPAVARLIIRCIRSASTRSTSPRSCNARTIYRSIWRPRACNPRRRSSWRGEYLWPVNVNNTLRLTSKTPLQKLSFTWVSSQGKQLHFFLKWWPPKVVHMTHWGPLSRPEGVQYDPTASTAPLPGVICELIFKWISCDL